MLGENIRALRKARGLSQQELAERLHVVRQTVSKWEQGLSVPDADMLVRLAECLEVSVEELLGAPKPESTVPLEPQAVLADKLSAIFVTAGFPWGLIFAILGCIALVILGVIMSRRPD